MAAALTRNAALIGAVVAMGYLPSIAFGLISGALVDRWNRRLVMVCTDLIRFLALGLFALLALSGNASVWWLGATMIVVGVGSCFFNPAAQAVLADVTGTDKEALAKANSKFWTIHTTGRSLLGPPIGSALFVLRRWLPFGLDAVSFAASAGLVSFLPEGDRPPRPEITSLRRDMSDGLRYAARNDLLRYVTIGMAACNFPANMIGAILVLYTERVMHLPAVWFGALLATGALGGVGGGLISARITRLLPVAGAYAIIVLVIGASWLAILLFPVFWAVAPILAVIYCAHATLSVVEGTTIQHQTPSGLLARVSAQARTFSVGSAGLGALAGGWIASVWGIPASMVCASVIFIIVSLAFLGVQLKRPAPSTVST
jgi:Na+/melibiose symporter-like transporter